MICSAVHTQDGVLVVSAEVITTLETLQAVRTCAVTV
jgi:hypothetical protein